MNYYDCNGFVFFAKNHNTISRSRHKKIKYHVVRNLTQRSKISNYKRVHKFRADKVKSPN